MAAMTGPVHRLDVRAAFESLTQREKIYAHYMACAAWHGAPIILRQVSPEANGIFTFIMQLFRACSGQWTELQTKCSVSATDMDAFVEYAATFLSNLGNYYGSGDQKFVPNVSKEALEALATASEKAESIFVEIAEPLGFPSSTAQSAYYPGDGLSREEIAMVSTILAERGILQENTRLSKKTEKNQTVYEVLQGSVVVGQSAEIPIDDEKHTGSLIRVIQGDHTGQLTRICFYLGKAAEYAGNDTQRKFLSEYIESFTSGNLDAYRESQKTWVKDVSPRVENILGFVEPYRDPYGIRAEWEGLVAISDTAETRRLQLLVQNSAKFIQQLPWVTTENANERNGPFEKDLFEPPDFTSLHALAYCSSIIFPGINLPNYNDIRQECGFKNVIIANRMTSESNNVLLCPFIPEQEAATFQKHKFAAYYIWVVLHELLGHGTSKLLSETSKGVYNFDFDNPPIDPVTSKPVSSWYNLGQSWTSRFEDLSTTVDECRAELVGAYLIDDPDLLALFGHTDKSEIRANDLVYNLYQQLGVDGLRGLQNFNMDDGKGSWGQAHSQAHFATLKGLLADGGGFMRVEADKSSGTLLVHVDRDKIISHGKPALGRMLLRLHMFRCTADVEACREYYGDLSRVDGEFLTWRDILLTKKEPKWKYVQANTVMEGEEVTLKEYDATNEGILRSWADRC